MTGVEGVVKEKMEKIVSQLFQGNEKV